jgi:hypothetical protein
MIARVVILLTETFYVPAGDVLQPMKLDFAGEEVEIRLAPAAPLAEVSPGTIGIRVAASLASAEHPRVTDSVTVNDQPTIAYDLLQMDMRRGSFVRQNPASEAQAHDPDFGDPSANRVFGIANAFLTSVISLLRLSTFRQLHPAQAVWRLDYLDDDGAPLPAEPGLHRTRSYHGGSFSANGLTTQTWEWLAERLSGYVPPPWHLALLEAERLAAGVRDSAVGAPIALANAALEAFIAEALNSLAKRSSSVSPNLWRWLNDRDNWLKEPSVEERYDFLLREFAGSSLKDDAGLWQNFRRLRQARNSFSHEGRAVIGKVPVTGAQAEELVAACRRIVDWVEERLPLELRQPRSPGVTVSSTVILDRPSEDAQLYGVAFRGAVQLRIAQQHDAT